MAAADLVRDVVRLLGVRVAAQHDVQPVIQRAKALRDRLPSLAPHDHGVPLERILRRARQLLEELHVAAQRPGQLAADADAVRLLARRDDHREAAHVRLVWALDVHSFAVARGGWATREKYSADLEGGELPLTQPQASGLLLIAGAAAHLCHPHCDGYRTLLYL